MWSKSYTARAEGLSAARVWEVWSDVNQWHLWQPDLEYAKLQGAFGTGNTFLFKPKGGPRVCIRILDAVHGRGFIDLTHFPLARMYGSHQFEEKDGGVEMTTTISMEGPLTFLWRKLVGQDVADRLAEQTAWLIERAAGV